MTPNIADDFDGDEPDLLAWQAACNSCHQARVARIMAEAKERREQKDNGEDDA